MSRPTLNTDALIAEGFEDLRQETEADAREEAMYAEEYREAMAAFDALYPIEEDDSTEEEQRLYDDARCEGYDDASDYDDAHDERLIITARGWNY